MLKNVLTKEYIFFLAATLLCVCVLSHFLFSFILGITLAYLFEPLFEKLISFFNIKKKFWAWIVACVIMLIFISTIIYPLLTIATEGVQQLMSVISNLHDTVKKEDVIHSARKLTATINRLGFHYSVNDTLEKASDFLQTASRSVLTFFGRALSATPEFVLNVFVFIFTWFIFLVRGKSYRKRFLTKIIPWEKELSVISNTVSSVLKALIVANVFVAIIQAFLISITLALFDIPRFVLLGMLGFFFAFLPLVGTAPLMLSIAAWCYFDEGRLGAAVGVLVCALLITLVDNMLRPLFMKGEMQISFFWIFLSIIGGIASFGIAGALLGPVVFALFAGTARALEGRTVA